jgi:hypothetical protein
VSAYTAIASTSETLRRYLQSILNTEFAPAPPTVSLSTPREMKTSPGVSLWLYRVVRDEFLTNQPPRRISASQQLRTPLPVLLHYLLTPMMANNSDTEQKILGKVLQIFYDHPVLRGAELPAPGLWSVADQQTVELRVTLETLSLEEITRVWNALGSDAGYQLCVSYQVQVVEIESLLSPQTVTPVIEVEPRYRQIMEIRP